MAPEDVALLEDQADFRGPLVAPEQHGYTIEYAGEEDVQGTPTYKLKVTNKAGEVSYLYLDKEYYVEIQRVDERTVRGQEMEMTASIGDYKEVDGVMLPFSTEISVSGAPEGQTQTMTFEKVELNVDIPDSEFEMPEAPPAPETMDEEGGDGDGGLQR
jgi:outer membrane lipoprotein-sorting protein